MSTPENAPKPKPRKRKSKAEREAELAAKQAVEAAKPMDPRFWFVVGGALLIVGLCVYFDPVNFGDGSQVRDNWLILIIQVMIAGLGKNPVAFGFGGLGLALIGWGIRSWLMQRTAKPGQ